MSIPPAHRAQWTRLPSMVRAGMLSGVAALGLSGCGQDAPTADDRAPEEIVHERAQQRWDALIAGDIERAYNLITPAYRSTRSLELYRARFGGAIQWANAAVQSVECEVDRCDVVVDLTYRMVRPRAENTRPMSEVWVFSDGNWWIHL